MTPSALLEDLDIPAHARGRHITLNLHDQLSLYAPRRPGAYLRISSDRFGLEAGVDRQLEDAEDTRKRLGWGPFAKVYKENDTSAFKKRKVVRADGTIDWVVLRPQFRQLLADLAVGVIDGIIFYDLDRLVRQPRDLEDLIDVVEYVKRPAVGSTGGRMNLINDNDRHMARMMCVMALKSSEDTARRVARQHLACASNGGIQGRIAYGWVRKGPHKGTIVPDEAKTVTGIFNACLTGETAFSIATQFNQTGIKPPQAQLWSSTMINKMLRNPRYAGMVSYAGKHRVEPAVAWDGWSRVLFDDNGRPLLGMWEPIVDPTAWSKVQFELQLRRQKAGLPQGARRPSVTVKRLLSGILICGKCGRGLVGHFDKRADRRSYKCPPSAHGGCAGTHIAAAPVEAAVNKGMEAFIGNLRFQSDDQQSNTDGQLRSLEAKMAQLTHRKDGLVKRWAAGTGTTDDLPEDLFYELANSINKEISNLRSKIASLHDETESTVDPEELMKGWRKGSVNQKRELLKRYLHGIIVRPPVKRTGIITADMINERIDPQWRTAEEIAAHPDAF